MKLTMAHQANSAGKSEISSALEDYLETVYLLVQEHGFARVKDIARARDVKAASVSIALQKLSELGLVRYERREFIKLTPSGEQAGREVFARHRLLARFFEEFLGMPAGAASEQACAMEHSLTDDAMERLVRFFEYLGNCPDGAKLLEQFRSCSHVHERPGDCSGPCPRKRMRPRVADGRLASLASLPAGVQRRVAQVSARGGLRGRLLGMGLLPDSLVEIQQAERDQFVIRLQHSELRLSRKEAEAILVAPRSMS